MFKLIELFLKALITTAADTNFATTFLIFKKNKVGYFMRIVCLKYHALFVNFEKAATSESVVCYKL